jgi:hypothetical protein
MQGPCQSRIRLSAMNAVHSVNPALLTRDVIVPFFVVLAAMGSGALHATTTSRHADWPESDQLSESGHET